MKNFKKILAGTILAVGLLIILGGSAGAAMGEGLVPCGGPGQAKCTFCHLYMLIKNIANFLVVYVTAPLAGLLFLVGGIMMITSGGSEEKYKKGRTLFINTIIGALIVLGSWTIVNTLITTLAQNTAGVDVVNWWIVRCK